MLFSILIPTYNNEKTIARTIKSALNQDYSGEYEIVIVNNASTDATLSVIESYDDPKIKVITNPTTVHMYENHNICVENALGDYVIFCHSDDELMPEALKILAKKIEERMYPQRYILWGHSMFRDFSFSLSSVGGLSTNKMFSGVVAKQVFINNGLTPSGTCFSRQAMRDLGGFPIVEGTYDIDLIFEAIAAFEGWEFEMLDRLLYKREYASTYSDDILPDIRNKQMMIAASYIYNHLNTLQKQELEKMYWNNQAYLFHHIFAKPLPTKQERLDALMLRYKRAPWKVWKLIKWILVRWNIWK